MATDPRAALDRLVEALQAHLAAAQRRRGDLDPAVESAYRLLADAFEVYDEALFSATDEVTPFVLDDDDEDDDEDGELDDEDAEDHDDDTDLVIGTPAASAPDDEDDDADESDDGRPAGS